MADPYLHHPKQWRVVTLEPVPELGYIERATSGSTPPTRNDNYWNGPFPWLTPKEVTGRGASLYVSTSERSLTEVGVQRAGGLLPPNTVMLTKRAPVGCVAINAVPMATNQGFMSFICGPKLRPLYLAYWLRINRLYLDKVANGSTYPELYAGDLQELQIAIPPLSTQDAILRAVRAVNYLAALGKPMAFAATSPDELVAIQRDDATLHDLREQLLPALMSGELNPHICAAFDEGGSDAVR